MKPWRTNTSPPSRISTCPWASAALPWPPCPRLSRPRPTSPGGLPLPSRTDHQDLVLDVGSSGALACCVHANRLARARHPVATEGALDGRFTVPTALDRPNLARAHVACPRRCL